MLFLLHSSIPIVALIFWIITQFHRTLSDDICSLMQIITDLGWFPRDLLNIFKMWIDSVLLDNALMRTSGNC